MKHGHGTAPRLKGQQEVDWQGPGCLKHWASGKVCMGHLVGDLELMITLAVSCSAATFMVQVQASQ